MTPYATLRAAALPRGFWFPGLSAWDLFVYGIRSSAPPASDRFDDRIGVAYVDGRGAPQVEEWPATTDPGAAALAHASNPDGCATLIPGQYRRCWTTGEHHPGTPGAYPCLVPSPDWRAFPVWRGTDRVTIHRDGLAIQLHHAGAASVRVGSWSEGCQVLQRAQDLSRLLELVRAQDQAGLGHLVSYALFGPGQI